jgi:hypothetical protein
VSLNSNYVAAIRRLVAEHEGQGSAEAFLNRALRMLAKWRSQLIANTLIAREGARVLNGPFAGMAYGAAATEGSLAARLLGSYESELHPTIMAYVENPPEVVIDIGCAEGYYAVGFARLLPTAEVHARDVDARARQLCAELAELNGVTDRVTVGGAFTADDFAAFQGRRTLVFIDAEGAEDALLDPEVSPALRFMDVIVETHAHARRGVVERLQQRFAPTHQIERLDQKPKTTPLPGWFGELGHLDQLLVVWEWRAHPTPWLVMRPKAPELGSRP